MKVKISVHVPLENADEVRTALHTAGAGGMGNYTHCSFSYKGAGRFMPGMNSSPHIGESNKLEAVEEEVIEVVCERNKAKDVLKSVRQVHPYEEVPFEITQLLDESEL